LDYGQGIVRRQLKAATTVCLPKIDNITTNI